MSSWKPSLVIAVTVVVAVSALVAQRGRGGIRVEPGQPCPPGMTETRPGNCQAPGLDPPSIVDYRPKSTVVADQHAVLRQNSRLSTSIAINR
jgi:hypothetical protein